MTGQKESQGKGRGPFGGQHLEMTDRLDSSEVHAWQLGWIDIWGSWCWVAIQGLEFSQTLSRNWMLSL